MARDAIAAAARPKPGGAIGISWLGLAGGVIGVLPLAALAVEVLVDPPETGRWPAAVLLAMSAVYLPAVWVSLSATPLRRRVQRGVVAASIVMVAAGLPLFGAPLAVLLMPATALLAIASGLVFSR